MSPLSLLLPLLVAVRALALLSLLLLPDPPLMSSPVWTQFAVTPVPKLVSFLLFFPAPRRQSRFGVHLVFSKLENLLRSPLYLSLWSDSSRTRLRKQAVWYMNGMNDGDRSTENTIQDMAPTKSSSSSSPPLSTSKHGLWKGLDWGSPFGAVVFSLGILKAAVALGEFVQDGDTGNGEREKKKKKSLDIRRKTTRREPRQKLQGAEFFLSIATHSWHLPREGFKSSRKLLQERTRATFFLGKRRLPKLGRRETWGLISDVLARRWWLLGRVMSNEH